MFINLISIRFHISLKARHPIQTCVLGELGAGGGGGGWEGLTARQESIIRQKREIPKKKTPEHPQAELALPHM